MQLETFSPSQTEQIGFIIGQLLEMGQVVALSGELAAGKTTLIKGICRGLGVQQPVDSPTFTLINEYEGKYPVYHLDCYREERLQEWLELGIQEYFYGSGVTLIEWAERIATLLPADTLWIRLEHDLADSKHRLLELTLTPDWEQKLTPLLTGQKSSLEAQTC